MKTTRRKFLQTLSLALPGLLLGAKACADEPTGAGDRPAGKPSPSPARTEGCDWYDELSDDERADLDAWEPKSFRRVRYPGGLLWSEIEAALERVSEAGLESRVARSPFVRLG